MKIINILDEIKKETKINDLKEIIDCIEDLSISPKDMEKKLIKSEKISFEKSNDKKNK